MNDTGHAVLYRGGRNAEPPINLVDFHVSIGDKLEAAEKWALAYPDHPYG
jgi:hypothetical protein